MVSKCNTWDSYGDIQAMTNRSVLVCLSNPKSANRAIYEERFVIIVKV